MYNPDEECDKIIIAIRELCDHKKMTMSALAKKAEISVSALSELMNGRTRPNAYTLFKICNALGVELYDLVLGGNQEIQLSWKERELIGFYRNCSESSKVQLQIVIDLLKKYDKL